jgi:hypothetical protein
MKYHMTTIIIIISFHKTLLPAEPHVREQSAIKILESLKQERNHLIQNRYAAQPYRKKWFDYTKKINKLTTEINSYQLHHRPEIKNKTCYKSVEPQFTLSHSQRTVVTPSEVALIIAQISAVLAGATLAWKYYEETR